MAAWTERCRTSRRRDCANGYVWMRRPGIIRFCLRESLEYLAVKPDGIYVDMTAGLGGHTAAIAARLQTGFVIACDRDARVAGVGEARTRAR